jgi:hypothetical protein
MVATRNMMTFNTGKTTSSHKKRKKKSTAEEKEALRNTNNRLATGLFNLPPPMVMPITPSRQEKINIKWGKECLHITLQRHLIISVRAV